MGRTRPLPPICNLQFEICDLWCALLLVSALALPARAAVELPVVSNQSAPVSIRAGGATHWRQGAYEVWVLRDQVRIEQANVKAEGDEAVLWIDRAEAFSGRPSKVIAYLDGRVHVDFGRGGDPHAFTGQRAHTLKDRTWLGRFHTTAGIELAAPLTPGEPAVRPAVFERGMAAWQGPVNSQTPQLTTLPTGPVQPAQYAREEIAPPAAMTPLPGAIQAGTRVRIDGRSGGKIDFRFANDPQRGEGVLVVNSGVRMTVFGLDQLGTVGVEADRVVVWAPEFNANDPNSIRASQREGRIEIYMEGNIVFRQGDRVIYADRMYYNVQAGKRRRSQRRNAHARARVPGPPPPQGRSPPAGQSPALRSL